MKAELHADVAELQFDFVREFVASGVGANVALTKNDAELVQATGDALTSAATSRLDSAVVAADNCIREAGPDAVETRSRCEKTKAAVVELRQKWPGHLIQSPSLRRLE